MTNAIAAALTLSARIRGGTLEWADTMAQAGPSLQDLEDGQGIVVSDGFTPVAVSKQDDELCRLSAVCAHLGGIETRGRLTS